MIGTFNGIWKLSDDVPFVDGVPHYVRRTLAGEEVHLFRKRVLPGGVLRWIIGPAVSDENGWAFIDESAASPEKLSKQWMEWNGEAWTALPLTFSVKNAAEQMSGTIFEVLSSKSQTEEGGCMLRGEAGAGAAFDIAAAGGTGVWSFKIIRTNNQTGLFAYVGVASESFSAAHGGSGYMFHFFDGNICSTENAHEQMWDNILLGTSDALKGKTNGALIDVRVREDGGKRYVAFRVNGGIWNEVAADGLPAVVRPYARCGYDEDRIRLEKAPAIKADGRSISRVVPLPCGHASAGSVGMPGNIDDIIAKLLGARESTHRGLAPTHGDGAFLLPGYHPSCTPLCPRRIPR